MTESTSDTAPAGTKAPSRSATVLAVVLDLGLPLVAYYVLHLFGATDWVALFAATAAATLRVIWFAIRNRQITWFAATMMMVFGLGLILGLLSGDARFLLIKDSFGTAGAGLVHLISLGSSRPFVLAAVQTWKPAQAEEFAHRYRTVPEARRLFRRSGLVWGIGLITEALLRIPMIFLVPIDVGVGLSTLMMVVFASGLTIWNVLYVTRIRARCPQAWITTAGKPEAVRTTA